MREVETTRAKSRARILLAEDSPVVAQELRSLLSEAFDVAGCVKDGLELLQAFRQLRPDVLVSDVSMPGMDGIHSADLLQRELGPLRIVFVTVHADASLVARAMALGQCGYVLKPSAGEDLVRAIDSVLSGKSFVSESIAAARWGRDESGAAGTASGT